MLVFPGQSDYRGDSCTAEILGLAGFDWLLLDGEHSPNDVVSFIPQLMALKDSVSAPIVRPQWNDTVVIKRLLDPKFRQRSSRYSTAPKRRGSRAAFWLQLTRTPGAISRWGPALLPSAATKVCSAQQPKRCATNFCNAGWCLAHRAGPIRESVNERPTRPPPRGCSTCALRTVAAPGITQVW